MAELTPHLIEGLMSNIPPQQDFRQAVTIVSADPGSVVYRIEVPQGQCNYHGTIFGGFVNCMLEAAAGMATYAYGMNNVAISCATNFIRAVKPQLLTVSANTTHKGRTTTVCHVDIKTTEGKLVAESTFTMFLLGPLESDAASSSTTRGGVATSPRTGPLKSDVAAFNTANG